MALVPGLNDREYAAFVETSEGEVAKRVKIADFDGDMNVNIESNSISTTGIIGKPSGTNGDFTTAYASATTITVAASGTADKHELNEIADIVGTGKEISSVLICRLTRVGTDELDTYASAVYLVALDFHIEKDRLGSRT